MHVRYSYLKQQFSNCDDLWKKLKKFVVTGDFTLGKELAIFEKNFAKLIGTKYAIGVNSGTDALKLSLKSIGIKPGDEIKTYNVETGKLENEIIEMITAIRHDNLVTYKLDNNTKITATLDHPFFVEGESNYTPLRIGDKVKNDELNVLEVVEIELNQGVEVTYNIEKTRNGNYFANKVLVSDESEIPFT